jgi:pimeloyl-ACP methyl ester carboxylesterase
VPVQEDVSFAEEQGIGSFHRSYGLAFAEQLVASELPEGREFIKQPGLMLFTLHDYACQPALYGHLPHFIADLETVDFVTSHWITWEQPDKVNRTLESFISRKVQRGSLRAI